MTADPAGADLLVMTFNIRNDRGLDGRNAWWLRRRATVAAVRDADPDVVGLQEVRPLQLRYLTAELPEYGFLSRTRANRGWGGEACPILYRRSRFRISGWDVRWYGRNRRGRIATMAHLVDDAAGTRVGVVNTHLDFRSPSVRWPCTETLVAWLAAASGPWVVMGDLNATADEESVALMLAAGYRDALAHLAVRGAGVATSHRFTGRHDGKRIDHVLVGPGLDVVDSRILHSTPGGRLPSDHWPVVARLRPQPDGSPSL